ncbi:MAG: hypothetical protein AAGI52_02155 [Bacteroidota bacterium]
MRILLLAVFALVLVACDSGTDETTSVTITRAEISDLPFSTSPDPNEWNDAYLVFRVGSVNVRATRNDTEDINASDLSFEFDFGSDITLTDLGQDLVVEAKSRDGSSLNDDTLISETQPVSIQSLVDAQSTSRQFSSADGQFRVRLNLEYD